MELATAVGDVIDKRKLRQQLTAAADVAANERSIGANIGDDVFDNVGPTHTRTLTARPNARYAAAAAALPSAHNEQNLLESYSVSYGAAAAVSDTTVDARSVARVNKQLARRVGGTDDESEVFSWDADIRRRYTARGDVHVYACSM